MEKNGAELLRLWTAAADYQGDVVFSETILAQLGESYRKIRNTCRYLLSNLYDFVPSRDRLEDHELRELDLLALGVLRERDHQIFDGYKRYAFHEVVRLMNDYFVTVSAEYLDPIKDALYCEGSASRVRRSVQTALYEMIRTIAVWMAPVLCFTAQDVADELGRTTGEAFDVHGAVRIVDRRAESSATPTSAGPTRSGRGARRSCSSWRRSAPPATSRWRRACASRRRRPSGRTGSGAWPTSPSCASCRASSWTRPTRPPAETVITVDEAPGPTCPRCWRRTGESAGAGAADPDLCLRCAAVIGAAVS